MRRLRNTFTTLENTTIFMNAVTANFDGVENLSIEPKSLSIEYNTVQHIGVFSLLVIFGIPVLILVVGFVVWFKRRKMSNEEIGRDWMTKKTKKLLLLFGILLLLLGILFGIQARNKHQEEKDAAEKEAAKIYVTDLKNVSEVRYNVGNGEFVFAKQNDTWFYTEDSDFPLKQSVPEQIIDTFGKLEAQRELKDGDSLEAYGLKNPVYTVSLTTTDGTQTTLQFGNAVDDSYYLTVEGTNRVYTVAASILDELQYTMDELAQFDTYPEIGSGNLLKETITENGKGMHNVR